MNNWPKFLPHPTSWARGFALSINFWLIVSVLSPDTPYYYGFSSSRSDDVITFAWLCQILLFAFYHWGITKLAEWVEIRRHNQQLQTVSVWQHWREGFIAFLTLPAAIVMGTPAIAIFLLPVRSSSGAFIALILGTAIASAYLYHFRFGRVLKFIIKPCWSFFASFLKVVELLLVPPITGIPFLLLTVATAEIIPRQLLPLTTFLLIVCIFWSGIVGYAVLHHWSAHFVNWTTTWWPVGSPGYGRLQARKVWKHNKTATNQSFVRHTTSWHLAANDATYLIYSNFITILLFVASVVLFGEPSKWSETEEEILGTATILACMAVWHFWGWQREVKIASSQTSVKKRSPKNLPATDPVEKELNQLKAESGISHMKTARRSVAPVPETAEWYVFRSGSAEGPYTKMQLLEIQKITDRTKVRRGETEWQRAGDISELVAYLTEK